MAGPKRRAFRARLLYRLLRVVTAIGRRVPMSVGRFIGRALGTLAWHVVRRERRKALANIAIAFPEWTEAQRRDAIRAMFRHHGMSVFEIAWLPNLGASTFSKTTVLENFEPTARAIDAGRGVVTFTAHTGNWEWLAATVGLQGRGAHVLQRERDEPQMNRFITELRASFGVTTIDRGSTGSAREMFQAIRRGGILAFLIDQNIRTESAKVPFFGRPALTPIGPAKLAVRTNAVVVSCFAQRLADGRHLIRFNDPFEVTRDDDPIELTARITRDIEAQIRRAPEQWVWMHDRWRERPQWDVGGRATVTGDG